MLKKKCDNYDFYAGESLASGIIDFISGKQPAPENLGTLLDDDPYLVEMLKRSADESYIIETLEKYYSGGHAEQITRMKHRFRVIKQRRMLRIASVSAAAIFVLALFVIPRQKENSEQTAKTEKLYPRIILADGASMILIPELSVDDNRFEISGGSLKIKDPGDTSQTGNALNTLIIPSGSRYTVELSDGSTVTLNARSILKYPSSFISDKREVILEGEGFFDIAGSSVPFRVKADGCTITAYGTGFNVKTVAPGQIETILLKGSIGVMREGSDERMLIPGQKAKISHDGIEVTAADIRGELSWLENDFNYHNKNLKRALFDIENWYGIRFEGMAIIPDYENVNICVSRDLPLSEILSIIEKSSRYKFNIMEGGVVIETN